VVGWPAGAVVVSTTAREVLQLAAVLVVVALSAAGVVNEAVTTAALVAIAGRDMLRLTRG